MGRFQAKNRVIEVVAAALALFAVPAYPSSMTRAPASQADQPARDPNGLSSMAQADAFSTAGEQAAFLGAYQMSFGPYGEFKNPEDRQKIIRETAAAIDDCINGRACGEEKQEKVLKALIHFNMGQDIKMMMLTNNTNQEKMRSIDNSGDASTRAKGQGILSQQEIKSALESGKDITIDQSDPIKPYQSGKVVKINRDSQSTKEPYFNLDETKVTKKIDESYLREREILGDKFLKEYGAFIDDFTTTSAKDERRFYKYVPSKANEGIYVHDAGRSGASINQERFSEIQAEQQNPHTRELVGNYKRNMKAMRGYRGDDGRVYRTEEGSTPEDLGIGEMTEVDPARFPSIKFDDLMEDGKIPEANRGRAVARIINETIKKNSLEKEKEEAAKSAASRTLASSSRQPDPGWIHTATLSPQKFDEFLDEIWPSAAGRQKILSSAPPVQEPQKPAEEPADDFANRDRYGRPLDGIRPTDNRRPRQ